MTTSSDAQSDVPARIFAVVGVVLLVGVAVAVLDRAELTNDEGRTAQVALGPFLLDTRGIETPDPLAHVHGFIRGFALFVGTTERALRLGAVLSALLGALLLGEVARVLAGPRARGLVYALVAASPLLLREDLFRPGILAALPAALVLSAFAAVREGRAGWFLAVLLGVVLSLGFEGKGLVVAGAAVGLAAALEGPSLRSCALLAVAAAPVAVASLLGHPPKLFGPVDTGLPPHFEPGPLAFGGGLFVAGIVAGLVRGNGRPALASLIGVGLGAAVVAKAPGPAVLSASLVGLGGILAVASLAARANAALPALLLVLAIGLIAHDRSEALQRRLRGHPAPAPLRDALADARDRLAPGGRLLLAGDERFAFLYYARRGHDPGVPVLLVPEDVTTETAAAVLKHQLRIESETEAAHPPILWMPRTALPPELPGLATVVTTDLPERAVTLDFSALPR